MKKIWFVLAGILIVAAAGGALYLRGAKPVPPNAEAEKPLIVTSFYPLYFFTSRIAEGRADVVNISQGLDPHDFIPSTSDTAAMHRARAVVLHGAGLESWGGDTAQQLSSVGVPVIVATKPIALATSEEDAHHEEEHDQEEEHNHGEFDPHTWLSPSLAAEEASYIASEMETIDPAGADIYRKNTAVLLAELNALDEEYRAGLSHCAADETLISHDALGYIARQYGLVMHPIAGISTQDEPSAALLAQLREEARSGVSAILTEETAEQSYAETLARETGLALIPINAFESGVFPNGGDYISGMRENLAALKKAYECR